tara:strand:- start:1422 stop:1922 length:501 start_codon:yes stop_codon:yes gene_type:complete
MGKKSLKNYKKQQKEDAIDKSVFQHKVILDGNDLIKKFKGDFDAALLHCLDRKLDDILFDYIYDCQLDHEKYVEEQMKKIQRKIDDHASDVAIDFQIYSEERNLDLAANITGSDISDFVMYLARQKLYPPSVLDSLLEDDKNGQECQRKTKKPKNTSDEIKWTVLN